MGEVGGWRFFTILLFSYKQDCLQESESFHLNSSSFQSLVSCGLAGLPHVPVFSRVGGDEMNRMKVKVLSLFLDLIVNFSWNASAWYGLEDESTRTRFNKCKYLSLYCSEKICTSTSKWSKTWGSNFPSDIKYAQDCTVSFSCTWGLLVPTYIDGTLKFARLIFTK